MSFRKLLGILIPLLLLMLSGIAPAEARSRLVEVYNPEPIKYNNASPDNVGKRIRAILTKRRWVMKRVDGSHVRASFEKSSNKTNVKAVINIKYGAGKILISYHDSEGFRYNKSAGVIHKRYNSWVKNIERDLRVEFGDY